MNTHSIFIAIIILWMSIAQTAYSQGLKTLEELTESAPVIVTGTVLDVQAETREYLGRDDFIFTYVTVCWYCFLLLIFTGIWTMWIC